jgi:hypothetical protein
MFQQFGLPTDEPLLVSTQSRSVMPHKPNAPGRMFIPTVFLVLVRELVPQVCARICYT